MPVGHVVGSGRQSAHSLMVWDPLVRLIHWSLALTILLNGVFVDEESSLHGWIGYAAVCLVVVRLVWGFIGPRHARFSAFPPNPVSAYKQLTALFKDDRTVHWSHNPLGALMVYNIWLTVLFLGATGHMMGTIQFFGVEWVEEAHEIAFVWLLVSIMLHVIGVIFDTWRTGVHLIRSMIDGRKRVPSTRQVE